MNNSVQIQIPRLQNNYDVFIRTDTQAPDARLIELFPYIYAPITLENAALLVHHVSLYWDALADKSLPWSDALLKRFREALTHIQDRVIYEWDALETEAQLRVFWALLRANNEGIAVNSNTMFIITNGWCSKSVPKNLEPFYSHLNWMLRHNSYWVHLYCDGKPDIPLLQNPNPSSLLIQKRQMLKSIIEQNVVPTTDLHDLENWYIWEIEKEAYNRYANLRLQLDLPEEKLRGRFHEWQYRGLEHTFEANDLGLLTLSGVGRLYLSEWSMVPSFSLPEEQGSLKISRTLNTERHQFIQPNEVSLYQQLLIQTEIQSKPRQRICIMEWGASGLSGMPKEKFHCGTTNGKGRLTYETPVTVSFEGLFRLPSSYVSNGNQVAHSGDMWFSTIEP